MFKRRRLPSEFHHGAGHSRSRHLYR
jgi:hypothetical protein